MKTILLTILIMLNLTGVSQIIMVSDAKDIHKGKQVYQIVISLSDTTIKQVVWTVASGSAKGDGNEGVAFCFGQPKDFERDKPDYTGVLRVYNPEPIIKRGIYKSWKILVIAYNPANDKIVYRNYEELMFSELPTYKPPINITPYPILMDTIKPKTFLQRLFNW